MTASLATRSNASRKGWEARRLMKRAREDALAAALAGGPPLEARWGGAPLAPDDSNPGVLMRRAIDRLKARECDSAASGGRGAKEHGDAQ